MTMKLIQKRFFKGTREFEIIDDTVYVRMKGLLKEEKSTVGLSILNPEPEVSGSELEFHALAKREPLLSLFINNPNDEEFNTFVNALKQRVLGENRANAGVEAVSPETSRSAALGWNVYEEPPDFDETDETRERISYQAVNAERLDKDITMLKTYLDEGDIGPLLDSLKTLKEEPQNEVAFQKMVDAYNDLGIIQGAVLTYAPYLKVLLSESIRL